MIGRWGSRLRLASKPYRQRAYGGLDRPARLRNLPMTPLRVTVSGIRNRTHVVYVASWLRQALHARGVPATLVEINGANRIAAELERSDSLLADIDVEFVERHPSSAGPHYFVSIGSPGTRAWARFRCSPSAWPLRTVAVDEGIGSYGDVATKRAALRREGSREPWSTVRALAGVAARRLLPDESWRLYERDGDRWSVNDSVAAEFRRASTTPTPADRVVYLTQPWVDHGLVSESDYLAHLAAVAEEVGSAGHEFGVRPHPTEPVGRYAPFRVFGSALPAELDPEVLGARLVLGETSTALLNLAAVHGLPAARVIGPLADIASIALSDGQAALFTRFVPASVRIDQIRELVEDSRR
jgi:hypothetical protein